MSKKHCILQNRHKSMGTELGRGLIFAVTARIRSLGVSDISVAGLVQVQIVFRFQFWYDIIAFVSKRRACTVCVNPACMQFESQSLAGYVILSISRT